MTAMKPTDKNNIQLVVLSTTIILFFICMPSNSLSFNRLLIEQGEWWRVITGSLVHTNIWHVVLNISSLVFICAIYHEHLNNGRLLLICVPLWASVGIGIYWMCPQTQWYMGLSGSLHGLVIWGVMQDFRHRRRFFGSLGLAGVMIKLCIDYYTNNSGEGAVSGLIGARVHIESHMIGAAAGLLLNLYHALWVRLYFKLNRRDETIFSS